MKWRGRQKKNSQALSELSQTQQKQTLIIESIRDLEMQKESINSQISGLGYEAEVMQRNLNSDALKLSSIREQIVIENGNLESIIEKIEGFIGENY